MITLKERYLVDEKGDRVGVLLDISDYRKLLEDLEELESVRAYDAAIRLRGTGDESIPFEQAIADIERKRRRVLYCLHLETSSKEVNPNLSEEDI